MEVVARAGPDGYTLALAPAGNLTVNPSLFQQPAFDICERFRTGYRDRGVPNVLVVTRGSGKECTPSS